VIQWLEQNRAALGRIDTSGTAFPRPSIHREQIIELSGTLARSIRNAEPTFREQGMRSKAGKIGESVRVWRALTCLTPNKPV
jgi:hypothetical protein